MSQSFMYYSLPRNKALFCISKATDGVQQNKRFDIQQIWRICYVCGLHIKCWSKITVCEACKLSFQIKGLVHNFSLIYSSSCRSKPVGLNFFWVAQKEMFWRMLWLLFFHAVTINEEYSFQASNTTQSSKKVVHVTHSLYLKIYWIIG